MKHLILSLSIFSVLVLGSCGQSGNNGEATAQDSTAIQDSLDAAAGIQRKGGLTLSLLGESPAYPDAKLSLVVPKDLQKLKKGDVDFEFGVENYQLGAQTADAQGKGIANSDKGQHIHFILNNGPYTAYYEPKVKTPLEDGDYVLLAFLARSYHESLKTPGAFVLKQFTVGKSNTSKMDESGKVDLNAPHLFFSRPKGKYVGPAETEKLLLDFYLVNCDLGPDGYKVRATINGNDFMLTKWAPYVVEGLPLGEVKIKLELLDKDNQLVASPFNPVERTATLEAATAP